jgi:endonuclease YncB( thermonuclease family)
MSKTRRNVNGLVVGLGLLALAGMGGWQYWQASGGKLSGGDQVLASVDQIEVPMSEQWEVASVTDGDSFTVRRGGEEQKIRLCGVDAPEKTQPLGKEAKEKLQQLVDSAKGKVAIVPVEKDRYGRTVAEVFLMTEPEQSAQEELLTAGMVYVYPKYVDGCPNAMAFKAAEAIGKSQKVGVWEKEYQRPWDYRQAQREQ